VSLPQIFVSGTWRTDRAAEYASAATTVGALIAKAGYSLACGPGTGIARHAIDGFRSVTNRVGVVRYHLPARHHMEAVGEEVLPGYDEIEQTELDYPMRNVYQVSKSAGLIAISGGDGTLEEILPALIDYQLPVAVLKGAGQAATALEVLLGVFPEWQPYVLIGDDPEQLADFVLKSHHLRSPGEMYH
jgi:predicted Rossmann-fold nucleotide-binding protein